VAILTRFMDWIDDGVCACSMILNRAVDLARPTWHLHSTLTFFFYFLFFCDQPAHQSGSLVTVVVIASSFLSLSKPFL